MPLRGLFYFLIYGVDFGATFAAYSFVFLGTNLN